MHAHDAHAINLNLEIKKHTKKHKYDEWIKSI